MVPAEKMMFEDEFPIDYLHSTGRRQFLYSLLALFLLARGKASVAKSTAHDLFYVLDLRTGDVTAPAGNFIASGAPGSLLKLVLTAAFCEGRLPAAHQTIICNGTTIVDGTRYSCRNPHGRMHLPLALGYSCNVFFANVIGQLSQAHFARTLERFSLKAAARTALESRQLVGAKYIDFTLGLTKEITVDALDVLMMVALVAKQGKINALCLHNPVKPLLRVSSNPFFQSSTWNVLQEGMELASRRGTARNLDIHNKLHLAVKTGTTQNGNDFKSWLAGYFPFEEPKFAFCVRSETGTSYDSAVPLARRLLFKQNWS
jgi:cell division protein FtsI/penicillin-binding protein 2